MWGNILKLGDESSVLGEVLSERSREVGDGSQVCSWVNDWLGVGPLFSSFPIVFRLVVNKWFTVKDCYAGEGGFVN